MKSIPVTIDIPINLIAEAIVPLVVGALIQQDQQTPRPARRMPIDALLKAVEQTAEAVVELEKNEFTRAELGAAARVISAAKGLRKALNAQKIEEQHNGN